VPYPFLSDEWLTEVKKLAAEGGSGMMPGGVQLNMLVTGSPEGDKELHISDGSFGGGLVDGCPTKVTIPYAVARNMFISGDQAAAMQAFMSGQIKVDGDMSKLMAMQSQGAANPAGSAAQARMQQRLREITADD
jgi:hypothetical protein